MNNKNINEKSIDKYFFRNTFGISAVEVIWGLGLPVVVESTFLQLFLSSLGASKLVIGIIPAVFALGCALFSILSGYFTTHLKYKRRAVIITTLIASFPLAIFGLLLLILGKTDYTIVLFLSFYLLFSMTIGLTVPVWQNFTMKIFSEEKALRGISVMMICQIISRLIGGFFIVKMVSVYSFSTFGASMTFISVGLLFFLGGFFFLFVNEFNEPDKDITKKAHNISSIFASLKEILKNKNFIYFLLSSIEFSICITIISFYANYAVQFRSIPNYYAAGLFIVLIQVGSIITSVFFGWLNILTLKSKFVFSKIFVLLSLVLLIFAHSLISFLLVSFIIGLSRGINITSTTPMIKKLSNLTDATDYYALSPILQLPFSFGLPVICGLFLDTLSGMGDLSYKYLFMILSVLVIASIFCIIKINIKR